MCKQPPALTTSATKTTTRYARWLYHSPALLLNAGGRAPLLIHTEAGDGFYWVERVDLGWMLHREREDGEAGESYLVDTSFGGDDPETCWSCTCNDFRYRSRKRGLCKHGKAAAAALRKIGLIP